jgi:hypothetical protein
MTPATYTVTAIIVVLTLYGVRASSKTDPQVSQFDCFSVHAEVVAR